AGQVGMAPGQLALVGLVTDLCAYLSHRLLDRHARLWDWGEQGLGERRVLTIGTIERCLARTGSKRDQRTFTGFHFGETLANRYAAGRGLLDLGGTWIVAAGIEEHQLDLGIAHG